MNTVRWLIRVGSWCVLVSALILLVVGYVHSRRDGGQERQPGDPVHNMWLRLTIDLDLKIHDVEAVTDGKDRVGATVRAAWVKHDVAQCGYCQSGQIMSATAFLKSLPRGKQPTAAEIDGAMAGNICRCGTYARIRAGASLVQVYTGLVYEGPFMLKRLCRGLLARMQLEGIGSLEKLRSR